MGGKQRIIGLAVGIIGVALTGWSLFTLFASTSCIGLDMPCPGPGALSQWGIPAGIVLAVIGMVMGGGFLVFAGLFMAIGGSALAAGFLGLMSDMPSFPWLFGGIFFLAGLFLLFLGLAARRSVAAKQFMAGELMRSGVTGIGTITHVADTGMTINDNPRIRLTMRIEPDDGSAPVERSKTVTASRVAIPRAGERFPAWFDRADPDKWMYGTDMDASAPAEVKEMFARARAGGDGGMAAWTVDSPVGELARLTKLWKDGALTDAEFADAKARLLPKIGR